MQENLSQQSIVIVAGPTGSGKTALAKKLIQRHPFEIISADSRQVYRGLDIGTGKDTNIPQYMIDVRDPGAAFSVSDYQGQAEHIMETIWQKGNVPLIVGGTGYYIEALLYQRTTNSSVPHLSLRQELRSPPRPSQPPPDLQSTRDRP